MRSSRPHTPDETRTRWRCTEARAAVSDPRTRERCRCDHAGSRETPGCAAPRLHPLELHEHGACAAMRLADGRTDTTHRRDGAGGHIPAEQTVERRPRLDEVAPPRLGCR